MRKSSAYLHRHYPLIHSNFFRKEVGANGGFVACAELLVDLHDGFVSFQVYSRLTQKRAVVMPPGLFRGKHTYWFMRLVLPTPLSPRMMTCGSKPR